MLFFSVWNKSQTFIFSGQSKVSLFERVIAEIGDDVILHCYLGPVSDVSDMTMEWTRADLDPRFIHVWPERPDLQNPSYKGRTSLFTDKLKHGHIWLEITNVKRSDEGIYTFFSPELDKNCTVPLIVFSKWNLFILLIYLFYIIFLLAYLPVFALFCCKPYWELILKMAQPLMYKLAY